ncbi:T9SS type A sorting domain-containing protein, partial [Dolichospermum sp. ST_sed3]|nr:T9SS type A sorting domain-containing protein [Dolichospermum sp. ST_sed3]
NIFSLSISPDGQYCLTGCPAIIDYWRLSDGTLLWTKTAHGGYVNSVDISPDGQYALSGGGNRDNTVKYWRLSDATCLRTMSSGSLDVTSVNFSFDGHYALSGTWALYNSGTIHYWRLSDGVCLISIDAGTYTSSVAFSADGLYCLAGSGSSLAYFRLSDGHSMFSMAGHSAEIKSVDTNGQETGFSYSNTSSAMPFAFTAAPSPFSNELRLTLPNKAVIYSLSGRRIASFEKGVRSINTSLWQTGVYIIKCGTKTKRIVKID